MSKYGESLWQRWKGFKPSKVLWAWSCIGVLAGTVVVGFWHVGWVTGGTARNMAEDAAADARAALVASVCVERYIGGDALDSRLAELKEASRWSREDLIMEGDWATLPGVAEPTIENAAGICADRLADMEAMNATAGSGTQTSDDGQS